MSQRYLSMLVPVMLMLLAASSAVAGDCCGAAAPCEGVQYVEKTICVPEWVTEKQKVTVTEYTQEEKTREVIVRKLVPKTETKTVTETVIELQTVTKKVKVPVCRPVTKEVTQQYQECVPQWVEVEQTVTVMVPHEEVQKGTRKVCKVVPVKEKVTVKKDCGQTEEQVEVTVCKNVVVEEPYECTVTVCKPETRKVKTRVCQLRTETKTRKCLVTTYETMLEEREIPSTVCVPKQVQKQVEITTCELIKESQTETYIECVPHEVEKEVEVQVCKMVPKTVKVPVCQDACGHGCGRLACRRACCR